MNKLAITLVISSILVSVQAISVNETIAVVAGLLDGVIKKDDLKELTTCMTDVDDVSKSVETIYSDLSSMTMTGLLSGLEEAAKLVAFLPRDFQQCEGIRPDIDRFTKFASVFIHPSDLIQRLETNLPAHLNEIMSDVQAANQDYTEAKFFDFGENLGEVLVLAVGQVSASFIQ
ncbi:UNKNOWN [Stylonychia lemnae]|uniref:Uncharacterized protein n=1 Tax=Stylonychia lemnae TaxID=5949 RepID=A0A078A9M7_STYLE|nr:UNKNOWN [Stylonychia lemnae]|eukprot:CDW78581.1 UNKNOWN [Stylonychia lemnae]